jgi:uncharacterized protein YegP (UPF0339 family)
MPSSNKVEVYKGRDGLWRFRLRYANGEKGTASQSYRGRPAQSKANAKRGAATAHPGLKIQVLEK